MPEFKKETAGHEPTPSRGKFSSSEQHISINKPRRMDTRLISRLGSSYLIRMPLFISGTGPERACSEESEPTSFFFFLNFEINVQQVNSTTKTHWQGKSHQYTKRSTGCIKDTVA